MTAALNRRQLIVEHACHGGAAPALRDSSASKLSEILARVSGDENLEYLSARVQNYVQLSEARMDAVRQALKDEDAEALLAVAHSLTDSVTKIGAIKVMKLGISLQMLARREMFAEAERVYGELVEEYETFKRNLICSWQ